MSLLRLYDSKGRHIANSINGQLHAPNGKNIGHYLEQMNIFINMRGKYLGEIYNGNRLIYNRNSPYRSTNFGNYGNYGNAGNYGNLGKIGMTSLPGGCEDINPINLE